MNKWSSWTDKIKYMLLGIDYWLLLLFVILSVIGMIIMYSTSLDHFDSRFIAHGRNITIAFILALIISQIQPRLIMQLSVITYIASLLLLIAVVLFGTAHKGAQRWLNIGIEIQPSEIAKIAVPMMLAWWFHKYHELVRWQRFSIAFILLFIPVALIIKQPDLGTSVIVFCVGFSVIYFAGLNLKYLAILAIFILTILSIIISFEKELCKDGVNWYILRNYQKHRVCTMLDPNKDPLGKGFHVLQSEIAIGAGGITGRGFLQGTQTHLEFVPERTTDFIFASYAEEFGLIGNITLLLIFLCLIFRGLHISYRSKNLYSQMLASSMALAFVFYVFINIGMVIGILPVVGAPLPFISYGGTAMIIIGCSIGILLSISRDNYLETNNLKNNNNLFP